MGISFFPVPFLFRNCGREHRDHTTTPAEVGPTAVSVWQTLAMHARPISMYALIHGGLRKIRSLTPTGVTGGSDTVPYSKTPVSGHKGPLARSQRQQNNVDPSRPFYNRLRRTRFGLFDETISHHARWNQIRPNDML